MPYKFSDKYKDIVFYCWYENDRPGLTKLHSIMPEEDEHKPSTTALQDWYRDYGWEQRADGLDGEASLALDQNVIQRRVAMWENLETVGSKMVEKGREYLETHELSSDMSAIRAVMDGAELLRASVGQAEAWFKISKMTNAQLDNAFRGLLNKGQNEFSETIDGDSESIDEQDLSQESKDGEDLSG